MGILKGAVLFKMRYTAFSVSEIPVHCTRQVPIIQNTCLACAHVYVGCDSVLMNISEKVITVEISKVQYDTPKIPCLCFKDPLKRVTMTKYTQLTNNSIKKYGHCTVHYLLQYLLLCAYYP